MRIINNNDDDDDQPDPEESKNFRGDSGVVPSWLTKGRTALLQKDKSKGDIASNYRPITCLPLMWKLMTGEIADQIYRHLDQKKLLPEEQRMKEKI